MLRRQSRQRREYIYRKTVEQRQKAIADKRERLKHALDGKLFFFHVVFITYLFLES
jgi:hypothetical protein